MSLINILSLSSSVKFIFKSLFQINGLNGFKLFKSFIVSSKLFIPCFNNIFLSKYSNENLPSLFLLNFNIFLKLKA